jgi:PAS domain S-box-containing protein
VNDPVPARAIDAAAEAQPSYAGRTRNTQLEFEAILANATLGIAFTREKRLYLCNPRFAQILGYEPHELIGQLGEVVYVSRESYEALGRIAVPILASGRQLDVEWEFRRKDGSIFVARVIARSMSDQSTQQGTVWIVEDVSERRRHADEVARLLREQEAILGTTSVGIVFVKDRRVVRCNTRYEQMYGYQPGELDGELTRILYPNEEEYEAAQAGYAGFARGLPARRIGLRMRKDGSTFWNRADGRAVDPQNPGRGAVWTVEDVTEQRRAEEELQRVMAEQQALIDNVSVGIAFRRDRRTVRCNRRAARRATSTSPRRNSSRRAASTASSTTASPTCATSGCGARTARVSGAASPGARCSRATRRRATCGSSPTSRRSTPPRSACSARSPSRS